MVRFKSVESITETFVGTPFTVCDAVGTLLAIAGEAEGEEPERLNLSPMGAAISGGTEWEESARLKLSPSGAARSGVAGRKDAGRTCTPEVSVSITVAWRRRKWSDSRA